MNSEHKKNWKARQNLKRMRRKEKGSRPTTQQHRPAAMRYAVVAAIVRGPAGVEMQESEDQVRP